MTFGGIALKFAIAESSWRCSVTGVTLALRQNCQLQMLARHTDGISFQILVVGQSFFKQGAGARVLPAIEVKKSQRYQPALSGRGISEQRA